MKKYTIERLYQEAKELLEKYNFIKETHTLSVYCSISESIPLSDFAGKTYPRLNVSISYEEKGFGIKSKEAISIWRPTPALALIEFEEQLQLQTGNPVMEPLFVKKYARTKIA